MCQDRTTAEQEVLVTTTASPAAPEAPVEGPNDEVLEELLVEEISIDGMCGVY